MDTEATEETRKNSRELTVAVLGAGQWTLEAYAPGLQKFGRAWLLNHLEVRFLDPDARTRATLSSGLPVLKDVRLAQVFGLPPQQLTWHHNVASGTVGKVTFNIVEGTGPGALSGCMPDVVFVVNPPEHHMPSVRSWYSPGRWVVMEKPFWLTDVGVRACVLAAVDAVLKNCANPCGLTCTHIAKVLKGAPSNANMAANLQNLLANAHAPPDFVNAATSACTTKLEAIPMPGELNVWANDVCAFDHYLWRLWSLKDRHREAVTQLGFGPLQRVTFRMCEYLDRFDDWPWANARWQAGAIQDFAIHAAPLLQLLGSSASAGLPSCTWEDENGQRRHSAPTCGEWYPYVEFTQDDWRAFDLNASVGQPFSIDVGVGWRLATKRPLGLPDKFLLLEYQKGLLYADLAEPFQWRRADCGSIDLCPPLEDRLSGYLFPAGGQTGARGYWTAVSEAPVHEMLRGVLTDRMTRVPPPSSGLMSLTGQPGWGQLPSAESVMEVLGSWDGAYRPHV